jgi:hypothetical protein
MGRGRNQAGRGAGHAAAARGLLVSAGRAVARLIFCVLRIRGELVDRKYVADFAQQLGLMEIWEAILKRLERP